MFLPLKYFFKLIYPSFYTSAGVIIEIQRTSSLLNAIYFAFYLYKSN